MQLTGTIEERIHAAAEFGRAHRSLEYDEKKTEELYRKVGAPFTDAARKFWSDWSGVMDQLNFYSNHPKREFDAGKRHISRYMFDFHCLDEQGVRDWYIPITYPETDEDGFPDLAGIMKAKYGDDTVPVAEGGYYYLWILWIRPDGKLIAVLPDDGIENHYNTVEEFLCCHFEGKDPGWLDVTAETMELTGTLEERMHAAIGFARKHGGFEHCHLFEEDERHFINLSKLNGCTGLSEDEIFDLLQQELNTEVPGSRSEIILPGSIEAVEE